MTCWQAKPRSELQKHSRKHNVAHSVYHLIGPGGVGWLSLPLAVWSQFAIALSQNQQSTHLHWVQHCCTIGTLYHVAAVIVHWTGFIYRLRLSCFSDLERNWRIWEQEQNQHCFTDWLHCWVILWSWKSENARSSQPLLRLSIHWDPLHSPDCISWTYYRIICKFRLSEHNF